MQRKLLTVIGIQVVGLVLAISALANSFTEGDSQGRGCPTNCGSDYCCCNQGPPPTNCRCLPACQ